MKYLWYLDVFFRICVSLKKSTIQWIPMFVLVSINAISMVCNWHHQTHLFKRWSLSKTITSNIPFFSNNLPFQLLQNYTPLLNVFNLTQKLFFPLLSVSQKTKPSFNLLRSNLRRAWLRDKNSNTPQLWDNHIANSTIFLFFRANP